MEQRARKMQLSQNHAVNRTSGFLIAEALVATLVMALVVGTVLTGYVTATRKMAWSSKSAAAQAMAVQSLEQMFAAKWNPPAVDEMSSISCTQTDNFILNGKATNYVTISNVSSNYPYTRMVIVNCVWTFQGKKFTNTVGALRGPNY